ncbi:unnamed protein product [Didymodactylos carnosus]|uniref:Uncharacterized protein n=1 Tax=Didymodactylos carnosus TaxID=1234261 RepID=A0A8S2DZ42_9BILA|nr:unnamed protein product [Didymodactylos carnosus]CAF3784640.1 unnamed protein product [Didymodactylos carnosus]
MVSYRNSLAFGNWQNHRGTPSEIDYRNRYRRLRKLVKNKIDVRQEEYWGEVCEEIEKSIKIHDPATAFSIIRRLRRGSKRVENMPIKDKNGNLLVSSTVDPDLIDAIQIDDIPQAEEERQNAQPSVEEVRRALSQMESRKAPGNDEVTVTILKAGGEPVILWLYEIFSDIWKNKEMVED